MYNDHLYYIITSILNNLNYVIIWLFYYKLCKNW